LIFLLLFLSRKKEEEVRIKIYDCRWSGDQTAADLKHGREHAKAQ
jgi:hypothetical protein